MLIRGYSMTVPHNKRVKAFASLTRTAKPLRGSAAAYPLVRRHFHSQKTGDAHKC